MMYMYIHMYTILDVKNAVFFYMHMVLNKVFSGVS